jgi:hypothetical protein
MKNCILALLASVVLCGRAGAQTYNTNNDSVGTFAGSGVAGYLDASGTSAMFSNPVFIVADSKSNLFVWDDNNALVRKITLDGTVSTFAGGGHLSDGYGTNVSLSAFVQSQYEMAIDHNDVIYLTTVGGLLASVGPDTYVTVITNFPFGIAGICVDSQNNLYLSYETGDTVYRYQSNGTLTVFANQASSGIPDGSQFYPLILACDNFDNIFVFSGGRERLMKIDQNKLVTAVSGYGGGLVDGTGTNASFSFISSMCVDQFNDLIVGCGPSGGSFPLSSIRMLDPMTNVTTLAGSFTQHGYTNGPGYLARFGGSGGDSIANGGGVCVSHGILFVADYANQRIRELPFYSQSFSAASLQLNIFPVVTITGTVGGTYAIQTSPDMSTWTTQASVILTSSPYLWVDQNRVIGNKYYRAVLAP